MDEPGRKALATLQGDAARELPAAGVVRVLAGDSVGTGFVVSAEGVVVTCAHVLEGAPSGSLVVVEPQCSGERMTAVVEQTRTPPDVAILRLTAPLPSGVAVLPLGRSPTDAQAGLRTFGFPELRREHGFPGEIAVLAGRTADDGYPQLALRSSEATLGFSGAPIWDPQLAVVVGMVKSISGFTTPAGVPVPADPGLRLATAAIGVPVEVIRQVSPALRLPAGCPYRGLDAFTEDDVDDYFGRDDAIDELLASLARHDFVAVVAVSGSGKTSLLRAGLAKGLARRPVPGLTGRTRCLMQASSRPVDDLLQQLSGLEIWPGTTAEDTGRGEVPSGSDLAASLGDAVGTTELLVVVDQFERLYTQCAATERERFIDVLAGLAGDAVKVVIGVRADYYHELLADVRLKGRVVAGQVTLSSLDDTQLREAVVAPAEQYLRSFQPGLVDRLISDVRGRGGDLPLLQFALTELWRRDAETGTLTWRGYRTLGNVAGGDTAAVDADGQPLTGVRGALAAHAERVWNRLAPHDHGSARRILLGLVGVGAAAPAAGTLSAAVGRQAPLSEFSVTDQAIVKRLVDARLLTSGRAAADGQPTVEIAHEALLRCWPRLEAWVAQQRDFVRWRAADLAPYLEAWLRTARDPDFVLPRPLLADAVSWLESRPDDLAGPPADYITASVEHWAAYDRDQQQQLRNDYIRQASGGAVGTGVGVAGALAYLFWQVDIVGWWLTFAFLVVVPIAGLMGYAIGRSLWYWRGRRALTVLATTTAGIAGGAFAYLAFVAVLSLQDAGLRAALTGALLGAPLGMGAGSSGVLPHRVTAVTLAGPVGVMLAVWLGVLSVPSGWPDVVLAGLWLGGCTAAGFGSAHVDD